MAQQDEAPARRRERDRRRSRLTDSVCRRSKRDDRPKPRRRAHARRTSHRRPSLPPRQRTKPQR
nr:MAG TPA: hypothetical protein [Caudoviricetes sp.]